MGITFIYYPVNKLGIEYNWTHKDRYQKRSVGYNGLIVWCGTHGNYMDLLNRHYMENDFNRGDHI